MDKLKDLITEKYAWERTFGEPLPTLNDTMRSKLQEGIKYPTQQQAEDMAHWYNVINNIYISTREVKRAFEKADQIRLDMHSKIFGDASPWSIKKQRNKAVVYWNEHKAKKLGL